jgi:hypothetical protein
VAGRSAAAMYQRWEEVTANTPPAAPTIEFFHRYVADPENYTITQAVFDFMAQPRVRALLEHDHILRRYPRFTSNPEDFADVIDEFQQGKDEFISYNSAAAVHGYGLLTLDGQWLSPARPSAMTLPIETHEDRVAFLQAAEDYLASLTADTQLVIIEARI